MIVRTRTSWPAARARRLAVVMSLAALVAACSSQSSPSASSSSAAASSAASPAPVTPSDAASSAPSPVESTSPAPATARPTAWSTPKPIAALEGCLTVAETIDTTGTIHLAAECEDHVRLASSVDGSRWTSRSFGPPSGRMLSGPQIAFDGDRLTVAYTRLAPAPDEETCGYVPPIDVGVYTRTRSLPNGSWSGEQKLGETADSLASLRTANGLQAVIIAKDGRVFYETLTNGKLARHRIAAATGGASLRVGDDGRARVAFEAEDGIRLGTFDGTVFHSELIPGSAGGWGPAMVLGPGNVAYVLWNRVYSGGGCAEPGPDPKDGTYFATDAGGSWATSRLSPRVGESSILVDPKTGELNAIVGDNGSLVAFSRPAGGSWTEKTLLTGYFGSPVIRQDPTTGDLVLAFVSDPGGDSIVSTIRRS